MCFKFLDIVCKEWEKSGSNTSETRELWKYFPGNDSPINELLAHTLSKSYILPPENLDEHEAMIETIDANGEAIGKGVERPAVLLRQKRKKRVTQKYDPYKKVVECLEEVDCDEFMDKITDLAKTCPQRIS